jgi:hypothetical protein
MSFIVAAFLGAVAIQTATITALLVQPRALRTSEAFFPARGRRRANHHVDDTTDAAIHRSNHLLLRRRVHGGDVIDPFRESTDAASSLC